MNTYPSVQLANSAHGIACAHLHPPPQLRIFVHRTEVTEVWDVTTVPAPCAVIGHVVCCADVKCKHCLYGDGIYRRTILEIKMFKEFRFAHLLLIFGFTQRPNFKSGAESSGTMQAPNCDTSLVLYKSKQLFGRFSLHPKSLYWSKQTIFLTAIKMCRLKRADETQCEMLYIAGDEIVHHKLHK